MPNIKHWFNGLGYLHEFKFDDGELQYSASYVPCTQYEAAMPKSKVGERISTEQDWVPASGAPYVPNTGVTIRMVGDHQVLVNTGYSGSNEAGPGATWLETPFQYTGTPLQPDQGAPAPSHSQTDPDGRVFMFNALFGGASGAGYQLYTVAPGSTEQQQLNILGPNPALGVPTYQHAFSITSNYVVLIEQPCTYGQHGWDTFKWIPEMGTHWRIVRYVSAPAGPLCMRLLTRRLPSRKTGQEVYTLHSGAVFFMHTVNAYETDAGEIVLDVVTYPDNSLLDALYIKTILETPNVTASAIGAARLQRFVLPLKANASVAPPTDLSPLPMEMPTINYAQYNTKQYQFMFVVAVWYSVCVVNHGAVPRVSGMPMAGLHQMWSTLTTS